MTWNTYGRWCPAFLKCADLSVGALLVFAAVTCLTIVTCVARQRIWRQQTIQIWRCWPCLTLVRPRTRLEKPSGQPSQGLLSVICTFQRALHRLVTPVVHVGFAHWRSNIVSTYIVWVQNVASDAFTFEAWVRTTDFCHRGERDCLVSSTTYANPSQLTCEQSACMHHVSCWLHLRAAARLPTALMQMP